MAGWLRSSVPLRRAKMSGRMPRLTLVLLAALSAPPVMRAQTAAAPAPAKTKARARVPDFSDSISKALTEQEAIGLLVRLPVRWREHSPETETAEYLLTQLSLPLREFADATVAKLGAAVFQEKAIRRQERLERDGKRMFPNPCIRRM